jgi:lysozyme family protein
MIDRLTPLSFPIIDADRLSGSQTSAQGQETSFLNILVQSLEKPESVRLASLPSPNPAVMIPYAAGFQKVREEQESPMKEAIRFVLKQEGSAYVSRDGKEASKYGILQSTARGYGFQGSIKDLTETEAEAIYEKMWKESGAQKLPRDLAVVHFDSYINSPVAARKMLKACQGDTGAYLNLRTERYMRLAEKRPQQYGKYVKGWMNRVGRLRTTVAQYDNSSSAKGST